MLPNVLGLSFREENAPPKVVVPRPKDTCLVPREDAKVEVALSSDKNELVGAVKLELPHLVSVVTEPKPLKVSDDPNAAGVDETPKANPEAKVLLFIDRGAPSAAFVEVDTFTTLSNPNKAGSALYLLTSLLNISVSRPEYFSSNPSISPSLAGLYCL
jgi:hypothetical protein